MTTNSQSVENLTWLLCMIGEIESERIVPGIIDYIFWKLYKKKDIINMPKAVLSLIKSGWDTNANLFESSCLKIFHRFPQEFQYLRIIVKQRGALYHH